MHCINADVGYYAVLLNGYDWRYYREERNQKFMESVLRRLRKFWEYVETNTPPPPDYTEATSRAIQGHYSEPQEFSQRELPEEFLSIDEKRKSFIAKRDEALRQIRACDNSIKAHLGNSTTGVLPGGKVGYTYKANKNGVRSLRRKAFVQEEG